MVMTQAEHKVIPIIWFPLSGRSIFILINGCSALKPIHCFEVAVGDNHFMSYIILAISHYGCWNHRTVPFVSVIVRKRFVFYSIQIQTIIIRSYRHTTQRVHIFVETGIITLSLEFL